MPTRKAWNKKTILLALHLCAVAIVSALLWVYPPYDGLNAWILLPWVLFVLSTLALATLPPAWFAHRRFDPVFMGGEALLLGTILSFYLRGESWLFYPLLLGAVLLAALARRLVWAVGMGAAVAAAHLLLHVGQVQLDLGVLILQTALILTTAGVIGYLTEELSREEATTTLLDNALEISTLLAGALDSNEVYDRLTELVARLFRAGRVAVILTEPGTDKARVEAAVDKGEQVPELTIDLERYPEIQTALERRAPVVISRPDEHPDMADVRWDLPGDVRRSSILVVPILADDEPRGVLLIRLQRAGHAFSDHEIKFVRIMADAAGHALMRAEHFAELAEAARRDSLTGLYNMRVFHRRLAEEIERCDRSGARLSLVMLDADYLKRVNDTYGHLAGDRVIRQMARCLLQQVRSIDTVARYGGEEFAVLLPETNLAGAFQQAERLRREIKAHYFEALQGGPLTISCGAACLPFSPEGFRVPRHRQDALIAWSDQALYTAKRGGRDCSVTHEGRDPGG
ncbi:MAG: sensor domain-containing diguanylate cyclase [Gemmatimonadetes bacterium]|nr:sensor domain-containing diguanylate cyclase [Gemmatimonadota bacterium]